MEAPVSATADSPFMDQTTPNNALSSILIRKPDLKVSGIVVLLRLSIRVIGPSEDFL